MVYQDSSPIIYGVEGHGYASPVAPQHPSVLFALVHEARDAEVGGTALVELQALYHTPRYQLGGARYA